MSLFKTNFYFIASTFILSIVIFVTVCFLSHKNLLPVDGEETYGFPLTFNSSCGDCLEGYEGGFNLKYFIFDFMFFLILTFFVNSLLLRKK